MKIALNAGVAIMILLLSENAVAGDAQHCIEFRKATKDHWTKSFSDSTMENTCNKPVNVVYCSSDEKSSMSCGWFHDGKTGRLFWGGGGLEQVLPGKKLPAFIGDGIVQSEVACFAPRYPRQSTGGCE